MIFLLRLLLLGEPHLNQIQQGRTLLETQTQRTWLIQGIIRSWWNRKGIITRITLFQTQRKNQLRENKQPKDEIGDGHQKTGQRKTSFSRKIKPWGVFPIWVACGCEKGEFHLEPPSSPFSDIDYLYQTS